MAKWSMDLFMMDLQTYITTFLWEPVQKRLIVIWESHEKCRINGLLDLMKELEKVSKMAHMTGKLLTSLTQLLKEK